LREFSHREGATLFMTLLAGFATLLHRYSGQSDFIVGTVSAGRKQSELEGLLGCFQNPLALRMDLSGDPTFQQSIQRAKSVTLGALSHDDVPFSSLVQELHPDRVFSHNPLLQVLISLSPPATVTEPGWDVTQMGIDVGVAPIPGVRGGQSTFVGGDVAGIAATSKHAAEAWDFLSWTLGDAAQVEVVAKQGQIIARTDLAQNKYAVQDPNVVAINSVLAKGKTPYALTFNATYNDPQSPWTTCLRGALFGDAAKALAEGQDAITKSLQTK